MLLNQMEFYSSIAHWYDQIFPFTPSQRDFVISFGSGPELTVVDVGCGTGSLLISLADVFKQTVGMDPDDQMLNLARNKAATAGVSPWLIRAGMLDVDHELGSMQADRILCFGNTLVHLSDKDQVKEFMLQVYNVLKPGGLFLLQVINYGRILDNQLGGLPTLENDQIRFERLYQYTDQPEQIHFYTRLTIKSSGNVVENEVPLLALRPPRIREALRTSGLSLLHEYGTWKPDPFTPEAIQYIAVARKLS